MPTSGTSAKTTGRTGLVTDASKAVVLLPMKFGAPSASGVYRTPAYTRGGADGRRSTQLPFA